MNEKSINIDPRFSNFDEYKTFTIEEWELGNINELEAEGLILIIEEQSTKNDVHYRSLNEEEYNEKYK